MQNQAGVWPSSKRQIYKWRQILGFLFDFSHIVAHVQGHCILAKAAPTSLQHELFNHVYEACKQL